MSLESDSLSLLKELSESFGPSGFEREPAAIVKRVGLEFADEILHDKIGSVILKKRGTSESPKILMAGHMDEVGFVITGVDPLTGYLTFAALGGWFDQVLLGHRVTIRTRKGDVIGVIAAKPPHLLTPEEREKVVKLDNMFIDVGADRLGCRDGRAWSAHRRSCCAVDAVHDGARQPRGDRQGVRRPRWNVRRPRSPAPDEF